MVKWETCSWFSTFPPRSLALSPLKNKKNKGVAEQVEPGTGESVQGRPYAQNPGADSRLDGIGIEEEGFGQESELPVEWGLPDKGRTDVMTGAVQWRR